MKKIQWVKFHTRDFSLFRYYVYIESNKLPFYQEHFGKVFDYTLTVPDGKLVGYHHDAEELEDMTQRMYAVSCRDYATFERFSKDIFGWMHDFINFNRRMRADKVRRLSDTQLVKLFDAWYSLYLKWQISIYFYFTLEPIVTQRFSDMLETFLREEGKEDKLQEYQTVVMSPEKMNAVIEEQIMLLKTTLKIRKYPSHKDQVLRSYYTKFLWIPCYDIKDDAYTIEHFANRVESLSNTSTAELWEQLATVRSDFSKRKKDFTKLMAIIDDRILRELCKVLHTLVFYKDHRDDLRRQAGYAGKTFMNILADHIGLTLLEINYLTPPEIRAWLNSGTTVSLADIKARMPANYVLFSTPGNIKLFVGDEAERVLDEQLDRGNSNLGKIVKGAVGSKGKATGKVAIVRHSVSLSKVHDGDVLVAVTTHPEYVPAMKKCCAIVTDEGGITSHAAIVSRELGKPCIVASKNATQIFSDGDMVEVDAERGVVRKL